MYIFRLTFVIILFLISKVKFLRSEVFSKATRMSAKLLTFVSENSPVKQEITFYS